jgi:hypothetical protein
MNLIIGLKTSQTSRFESAAYNICCELHVVISSYVVFRGLSSGSDPVQSSYPEQLFIKLG